MPSRIRLDRVWLIIGAAILVRLVFLPLLNLLPEEAYYWSYGQHLDIGYLDHPPMVAWLIDLSQLILGKSQFAVRLPAFVGWFAFAWFMFRFAENTIGKAVGRQVVLLLAVLPIYMSVGFLMTPDAPMYVFWAGCLYFLERAILGDRPRAWYGVGVCLGLGLLSKYTIGLIVPATLLFLVLDARSRRWFRRLQPYLAVVIALILFAPVLYWNAQHHWISFGFQGSRRWSGGLDIQLHILLGSILILITPLGLYEVARVLYAFWKKRVAIRREDEQRYRTYLFFAVLSLAPLAVFVIYSLQGRPKLNWTGPVWLALLPPIAARISGLNLVSLARISSAPAKRWTATAVALVVLFIGGFGYLVAGAPGFRKDDGMKLPIAWKAYGDRIEQIERSITEATGEAPFIVGLDKYWLASEASFYDDEPRENDANDPDTMLETAGSGLFGGNGLMWNYWAPPDSLAGRNGIIVSFRADALKQSWVTRRFARLDDIKEEVLSNHSGEIGRFYWRAGYSYKPN